ncbi:hypothetical protein BDV11DRAFT_190273 [Aspergillus similis]
MSAIVPNPFLSAPIRPIAALERRSDVMIAAGLRSDLPIARPSSPKSNKYMGK